MVEIAPLLAAGTVQTFFESDETRRWADSQSAEIATSLTSVVGEFDDDLWQAFEALYLRGLHPKLRGLWHLMRQGGDPDDKAIEDAIRAEHPDIAAAFIEIAEHATTESIAESLLDVVAHTAAAIRQLGGRHDLLLPADVPAMLRKPLGPELGSLDTRRLESLGRVAVPRIDGLGVSDVVAIRRNSDAFELWRSRLSIALDRAHGIAEESGSDLDTRRVIAETLEDARQAVAGESRNLPSRLTSQEGVLGFVASVVGAAVGGFTSGASGIAAGSAGAALSTLLTAAFRPASGVPGYIRRHYVVFDERL
jgi:hypothetical protein